MRPTRRSVLAAMPGWLAAGERRRRNVLFIAADDLNTELGCYGHGLVKSPHIDGLAQRGVTFLGAYCNYPLSNPSRSSLLTGMRPDTTRVWVNSEDFRDALPQAVTLPANFREQGWFTARAGKIFHPGFDDAAAWAVGGQPRPAQRPPEWTRESLREAFGKGRRMWGPAEENAPELADAKTADRAIALLEKHHREPLFLAVGFLKPHVPLVAPGKCFDYYPLERIRAPRVEQAGIPPQARRMNRDLFIDGDPSEREAREAIRAYHACTSYLDAQVGRVLEAIERLRLWESTVVVLFGDNGFHLGEHGFWAKHSLFEESCRVPLIVAAPGSRHGAKCSRPVELVDLYPSLAELAGLPARAGLEGKSFAPLLADPLQPWKEAAFTQFKEHWGVPGYSVRTARWRYTVWDNGAAAELYDHGSDPREERNLICDAGATRRIQPVVTRLHGLLAGNHRGVAADRLPVLGRKTWETPT